jgi:hypothetical protein
MPIRPLYFNLGNLFFLILILILIGVIFISMYFKIRRAARAQKWKLMAGLLIRKAIFFEEDPLVSPGLIPVTPRTVKLLNNPQFRNILTRELINAKKSVSGESAGNLVKLYLQLELQKYALSSLKEGKWYVKARVIQELSIMELKQHLTKIYRFTNDPNDLLRMEAQVAIVRLYRFEGLRFLDVVSYPLSEWQQISLLHELSQLSNENFSGVEKWLQSGNKSVVIFALKLARIYYRFELHESICRCLDDTDENVRYEAILSLGEIYTDQTSAILIAKFPEEVIRLKITILTVLQKTATPADIPFLLEQLCSENVKIKSVSCSALMKIGPEGIRGLKQSAESLRFPLPAIIAQLEGEVL